MARARTFSLHEPGALAKDSTSPVSSIIPVNMAPSAQLDPEDGGVAAAAHKEHGLGPRGVLLDLGELLRGRREVGDLGPVYLLDPVVGPQAREVRWAVRLHEVGDHAAQLADLGMPCDRAP